MEEVENVSGFVQNMEKLELPNQLVAVLADPLLQKLLVLRPSAESYQRIANWLNAVLQDVIDGDADQATLWEVLHIVRDFVVQTKVCTSLNSRLNALLTLLRTSLHFFSTSLPSSFPSGMALVTETASSTYYPTHHS